MELILVNLKPQFQPRWMGGYGKGRGEKNKKKNKKNDKDLVKLHSQQFCLVLNRIVQECGYMEMVLFLRIKLKIRDTGMSVATILLPFFKLSIVVAMLSCLCL